MFNLTYVGISLVAILVLIGIFLLVSFLLKKRQRKDSPENYLASLKKELIIKVAKNIDENYMDLIRDIEECSSVDEAFEMKKTIKEAIKEQRKQKQS
ncbi:hypothetical protein [Mycoplasma sp. 4404]|uniref:hypothetical protein n=1 Tax=Mycoplasma sp. 4404 TaxID=3108530 RepID=UPI002B1DF66F|nr:hypothetical protein [Mycoplasma sp. 4404]MEA4162616.1 hypothetical protein [Mycoplasma sp. 4404]